MKPTLYLETTIPSYLVARGGQDVIAQAHRQLTRTWWEKRKALYDIYISVVVRDEVAHGDPDAARQRLDVLDEFTVLDATPEIEGLAKLYHERLHLPERAVRDAAHLAFACYYGMDYLLTWNCSHIANADVRKALSALNASMNMSTPTICTPEELMGMEGAES